jgi:hypothetical protein
MSAITRREMNAAIRKHDAVMRQSLHNLFAATLTVQREEREKAKRELNDRLEHLEARLQSANTGYEG